MLNMAAVSGVMQSSHSQLTEIAEHMRDMLENARKHTLQHYRNIIQKIYEEPSIIAQTHKNPDSRPVVSLRSLYLCLQCPQISTEAERDQHVEAKLHCFCGLRNGTLSDVGLI